MSETPTTPRIAGVILAGGQARRLGGIAKGLLRTTGHLSLIERLVVHMVRCGIEEIVLAANDEHRYAPIGCAVVPDQRTEAGPLAGIEAALQHFAGRCEAILCLPCDVPALSWKEMSALIAAFADTAGPLVYARTTGPEEHPLCAVVRTDLLPQISAALDRGERGVRDLWQRLGGAAVAFDNPEAFVNLNRPEDLEAWLAGCSHDGHQ